MCTARLTMPGCPLAVKAPGDASAFVPHGRMLLYPGTSADDASSAVVRA
jgi:hypothetical protein